jgi:hypothetical protein
MSLLLAVLEALNLVSCVLCRVEATGVSGKGLSDQPVVRTRWLPRTRQGSGCANRIGLLVLIRLMKVRVY